MHVPWNYPLIIKHLRTSAEKKISTLYVYKYSLYTICHKIIIIISVFERIIAPTPVETCSVLHCHHLRLQILIQYLLTCDRKQQKITTAQTNTKTAALAIYNRAYNR